MLFCLTLPVTPYVLTLTATTHKYPIIPSSSYLHKRRIANTSICASLSNTSIQNATSSDPLGISQQDLLTLGGRVYMTNITVNDVIYTLVIDTGSSDTWIASTSFQCVSRLTQSILAQSACGFATLFDPNTSPTYTQWIKNGFSVAYSDGEFLSGDLGEENVFIEDMSVRQTIGVVGRGWWIGDGRSSGLMGLAYSGLASGIGVVREGFDTLNYTSLMFTL
jgi:hypothetical protein